jgi:myo-inositol-1(or 4)-monophosphatase
VAADDRAGGDWLADDHALLVDAVRAGGAIALDFFGGKYRRWEKEPGDPVSEADHAVNDHLHAALQKARTDYGWLSEESEDDPARLGAERVWVVDPIDGTRAFIKHRPEFTVCAALVSGGRSLAACVFNPATDELFEATAGGGARLNGAPLRMTEPGDPGALHLLASRRSFERHKWIRELPGAEFAAVNSIAYRLCLVAAGGYDATVSLSEKSDWDLAAADLVVAEAGGLVSAIDGGSFVYNRESVRHPTVLAAAPALHARLSALLQS